MVVELVVIGPGEQYTVPDGPGSTCWSRQTSGRGTTSHSPSVTMPWAPIAASSAGWKTMTTVPDQSDRVASSTAMAPSAVTVCAS